MGERWFLSWKTGNMPLMKMKCTSGKVEKVLRKFGF
jgi:hypothetical protein